MYRYASVFQTVDAHKNVLRSYTWEVSCRGNGPGENGYGLQGGKGSVPRTRSHREPERMRILITLFPITPDAKKYCIDIDIVTTLTTVHARAPSQHENKKRERMFKQTLQNA